MIKRLLTYAVALFAMASCFKSESYNTTLVIIPSQQIASGDEFTTLDEAVVYAYVADTTEYIPMTYDAALSGVVTSKTTGSTLSPIGVGTPYSDLYSYTYEIEEEDYDEDEDEETIYPYEDGEVVTTLIEGLSLQVQTANIMLVIVDTINSAYAYCNYEVGMNLPTTYLTVSFRPWKTAPFTQGDWMYIVPIVEEDDAGTDTEE
ncbi:MAG: hypothetical protein R3Y68_00135 [Rikenellaceae bacterium]